MKRTLGPLSAGRSNNLDLIRFLSAGMVLFAHSLTLSGEKLSGILSLLNQANLGDAAVTIFFIVSGFLVSRSWDTSPSARSYFASRCLRIFPALAGVTLASVFLLGPIATTATLGAYFASPLTWQYMQTPLLIPFDWRTLPSTFTLNTVQTVNGSLWTVPIEFLLYIGVAGWGMFGGLRNRTASAVLLIVLFASYWLPLKHLNFLIPLGLQTGQLSRLAVAFAVGMTAYAWRDHIKLDLRIAVVALGGLVVSLLLGGVASKLSVVFGAYLLMFFAYYPAVVRFQGFARRGDYSYGLYLFAFPTQQLVVHLHGGRMSALLNFALAFPLTLLLAVFSWHLIEARALRYKRARVVAGVETEKAIAGSAGDQTAPEVEPSPEAGLAVN